MLKSSQLFRFATKPGVIYYRSLVAEPALCVQRAPVSPYNADLSIAEIQSKNIILVHVRM